MGVTIQNKDKSIDMPYTGFFRLRRDIAFILDYDFGSLYEQLVTPKKPTIDEFNKRFMEMERDGVIDDSDYVLIDFLFESDTCGKADAKCCKKLWNLIKDYRSNSTYGYIAHKDCATFYDFREIVRQCAERGWIMTWN